MEKIIKFLTVNILTVILAIVPPIAIWYFFQRDTKELEFTILSNVPIVSIEEKFAEGIEVQINKKQISSLYVVDTKLHNAGNKPIERTDFDLPLSLTFNGSVISPPQVLKTEPANLPVKVESTGDTVIIEPMLLNSGDSLTLRTRVADVRSSDIPVKVDTRIKGIKKVNIIKSQPDKSYLRDFFVGVLSSILVAISLWSLALLVRRARRLVISLPGGIAIELSQLEQTKGTSEKASELAERLQISRHDYKSNLLLLRLKIESQLRELARAANFGQRDQIGSLAALSRKLEERDLLDRNVGALIRDISPIMNRELHESESYLSEKEFAELQRVALSVVAALESATNEFRSNLNTRQNA